MLHSSRAPGCWGSRHRDNLPLSARRMRGRARLCRLVRGEPTATPRRTQYTRPPSREAGCMTTHPFGRWWGRREGITVAVADRDPRRSRRLRAIRSPSRRRRLMPTCRASVLQRSRAGCPRLAQDLARARASVRRIGTDLRVGVTALGVQHVVHALPEARPRHVCVREGRRTFIGEQGIEIRQHGSDLLL